MQVLNISERQIELMKHAIGWNYENRPYRKVLKAYRNRYVVGSHCDALELWEDLCEKDYARGKVFYGKFIVFRVSSKGIKLLTSKYRVKIIQEKEDIEEC